MKFYMSELSNTFGKVRYFDSLKTSSWHPRGATTAAWYALGAAMALAACVTVAGLAKCALTYLYISRHTLPHAAASSWHPRGATTAAWYALGAAMALAACVTVAGLAKCALTYLYISRHTLPHAAASSWHPRGATTAAWYALGAAMALAACVSVAGLAKCALTYLYISRHTLPHAAASSWHPRGATTAAWYALGAAMALAACVTVAGNAAVLVALRRAPRLPAHYPLASLAAADLMVGLLVLPMAAAREMFVFDAGWLLCACWSTFDVLSCTASILSLCTLGWERWSGITAPFARARRRRLARLFAACVWPAALGVALPSVFVPSERATGDSVKACTVNTNIWYVFVSVTCSFYFPAGVMCALYARILAALAAVPQLRSHRGRARRQICETDSKAVALHQFSKQNPSCPPQTPSAKIQIDTEICLTPKGVHLGLPLPPKRLFDKMPSPLKNSTSPYSGMIPRQRRATQVIIMLMSLFLFCWTPFFIMLPIDSLCACVPEAAWRACTWLGYANSALDPLVYASGSPSVRRALATSVSRTAPGCRR